MNTNPQVGIHDTVYVIGAGFSSGLGYPLTRSLLVGTWDLLEIQAREQLSRIIQFHHPSFSPDHKTTFPEVEQLLTEMAVNIDMFDASRPTEGKLKKKDLEDSRTNLLYTIAKWFHELYQTATQAPWLQKFVGRIQKENAAIISFNWDLVLDGLLFGDSLGAASYGLGKLSSPGPVLLKPHGSLNWYEKAHVKPVPNEKFVEIFPRKNPYQPIVAFLPPRGIISKVGRHYTPLIVPPAYLKDFNRPIFQELWRRCTDVLSTPRRLIFLGYSLPRADLQSQFILRCGFHNQNEGRLRKDARGRHSRTGLAEVTIVNPDQEAARRIEAVAGPQVECNWIPSRIEEWVSQA